MSAQHTPGPRTFTVLLTVEELSPLTEHDIRQKIERALLCGIEPSAAGVLASVMRGDWIKSPSQAWASSKIGMRKVDTIRREKQAHADFIAKATGSTKP